MDLNLNQALKSVNGSDILSPLEEGEEERKPFLMRTVCVNALLEPNQDDKNLNGEKKAKSYHLAMEIYKTKGKIDLSIDDIKLLKDLIGRMPSPLIVGQAFDILDPPKKDIQPDIQGRNAGKGKKDKTELCT